MKTLTHRVFLSQDDSLLHLRIAAIVIACIVGIASLVVCVWAVRPFLRVLLGCTPKTVKETKRKPVGVLTGYFVPAKDKEQDNIILPEETKGKLLRLTNSVINSRNLSFKNAVFHGPEFAAMSIAAKRMARVLGLDYASVCGCSIGEAELSSTEEVVAQIQTLFNWAKTSPNGMLLFIDRSEAFLSPTGSGTRNESNVLGSFLMNMENTGKDIMLILATNRADDLDPQVLNCCEERIFFTLLDSRCRKELIRLHFDNHITKFIERSNGARSKLLSFLTRKEVIMSVDEDVMVGKQLEEAVVATRGLCGRDIEHIMLDLQENCSTNRLNSSTAWEIIEHHHRNRQTREGENSLSYSYCDNDLEDITFV